jgi:hypothetical protein
VVFRRTSARPDKPIGGLPSDDEMLPTRKELIQSIQLT